MANYAENRKARFDYEILEKYEAGIELLGAEVKSVRGGHMSLEGAFVIIRGGEAFLVGANVAPYQVGNTPAGYDPLRPRRLLLSAKELDYLGGAAERSGLTIIPLSVYNKGRYLKVSLALARGKKNQDKRQSIKKRESAREISRTLKNF